MAESLSGKVSLDSKPDDTHLQFDIVIVGAGISGINAAYRIQTEGPPGLTYAILEGRDSIGGTWDLFRYPGVRSDSDIFTFGFPWNPWKTTESLASGDAIKDYMIESAQAQGIDHHICYKHKVEEANWNSQNRTWDIKVGVSGESSPVTFRSRYILLGTGYYDYTTPLQTVIPGIDRFQGTVIHPQFWPEDYDYKNKHVAIIGSGATAVTILPAMADKARRVTMLQRSPAYIFSLPSSNLITRLLCAFLPSNIAYFLNRLLWVLRSYLSTMFCRSYPNLAKKVIRNATMKQLPAGMSWEQHFKPKYNPWEQRLCACPNGDFYAALRSGKADVVTGVIKAVTEDSIELQSGEVLHPDAIVTATGLKLRFGGGIQFKIDGQPTNISNRFAWKTVMLQDVPNLFFSTGYEAASWTLGADVSARLFVRILHDMRRRGKDVVVPRLAEGSQMEDKPMMSLNSTYLKNCKDVLPKGGVGQWKPKSNYIVDMAGAKWGDISTDLHME